MGVSALLATRVKTVPVSARSVSMVISVAFCVTVVMVSSVSPSQEGVCVMQVIWDFSVKQVGH